MTGAAAAAAANAMTASAASSVAEGARTADGDRRRFTCNRGGGRSTDPPSSTVRLQCAWKKTLFTGTYTRRAPETPKSVRIFSFFSYAFGKYQCRQQSELYIPISLVVHSGLFRVLAVGYARYKRRFHPASIDVIDQRLIAFYSRLP